MQKISYHHLKQIQMKKITSEIREDIRTKPIEIDKELARISPEN